MKRHSIAVFLMTMFIFLCSCAGYRASYNSVEIEDLDVGEPDTISFTLVNGGRDVTYFLRPADGSIYKKVTDYPGGLFVEKLDSNGDGWFDWKGAFGRDSSGGWGKTMDIHEKIPSVRPDDYLSKGDWIIRQPGHHPPSSSFSGQAKF